MIYIHSLLDLNQKSAEIESVQLIRDLRLKIKFPLTPEKLVSFTEIFYLSETDREIISAAVKDLPLLLADFRMLLDDTTGIYESINVQRAFKTLSEIEAPLNKNLTYAIELHRGRSEFLREFSFIVNNLGNRTSEEERTTANERLNELFFLILRTDNFTFKGEGLIQEKETVSISSLQESLRSGYLFSVSLDEEQLKKDFELIKLRLPPDVLERIDKLYNRVSALKSGVDRAYEHNLRMIELSVNLYALIKMGMM